MEKLTAIATKMKARAAKEGKYQQVLEKGLVLTLRREGLEWVLSLTRHLARPSDAEMSICRRAFEVPAEAEAEAEEIGEYQVRRVRWPAASQEALFEVPAPARIFQD